MPGYAHDHVPSRLMENALPESLLAGALPSSDSRQAMAVGRADGWHAALELAYTRQGPWTRPRLRRHTGPLRVQKGFTPEGPEVWHQIIVHPPGGIAGGDRLSIDVQVDEGASVLLTSPGAAKWYRSEQRWAQQDVRIQVADGATLEWLPLESIVFSGAHTRLNTRFDLAAGASLIAAELICLGRPASGERFAQGRLRSGLEVWRSGELVYTERTALDGGDERNASKLSLDGKPAFGQLLASTPDLDDQAIERAREAIAALQVQGGVEDAAVTRLDRIMLMRWRGLCAEDGWRVLRAVWEAVRPVLLDRVACSPRIWMT